MRWKSRARLAAGAILTSAFLGANPALIGAGTGDAASFEAEAAALAQRDLDGFVARAMAGAARDPAILTGEHGWVRPVAQVPDGLLAVTADGTIHLVRPAEVLDWVFTGPDGKLHGSYRARRLLSLLPESARDGAGAALARRPLPVSNEMRDFLLAAGRRSL